MENFDFIYTLLLNWGVPSAIMGMLVWWTKKSIDKKEAARDLREQNIEQFMMILMQSSRANNILAHATAKAVQRIPDAKCNGDMTKALEEADKIHKKEKEFLTAQGLKHIFED